MGERILVVEDDHALREVTALHLTGAGYVVEAVADGEAALEACAAALPDAVVLDLMLPRRSGLEVCRELRARYSPSPGVVMVTARGSDADMVIGLDAGADDYVVKPFAPSVLLARLAALCRRLRARAAPAPAAVQWSTIRVDVAARRVDVRGKPLALTPTELSVLAYLCARPNQLVTRKQLLRKLEGLGWAPAPIHAVYGAGYRLGEP